jgi:hypothetical protein
MAPEEFVRVLDMHCKMGGAWQLIERCPPGCYDLGRWLAEYRRCEAPEYRSFREREKGSGLFDCIIK